MLTLTWYEKDAWNWRDVLPPSWFAAEESRPEAEHGCYSPDGRRIAAWCSLRVERRYAWLDYSAGNNAARNVANGIYRDHLLLTFADERRDSLELVEYLIAGAKSKAKVKIGNDVDAAVAEGDAKLVRHLHRERDPDLRRHKIAQVRERTGELTCEACGFDALAAYVGIEDACEVHHRVEIAKGPRFTTLDDLAILCASCHLAIHRIRPMPSVEAFRDRHVRFSMRALVNDISIT